MVMEPPEKGLRAAAHGATRGSPEWIRWGAAGVAVAAVVIALALTLFAGLAQLQPGWRVAQGPSLAIERALPRDQAARQADESRVIAR